MGKLAKMQGVPAHIETLMKKDERRHPAKCKYADGKGKARTCKCKKNANYYSLPCHSAARCDFYKPKI